MSQKRDILISFYGDDFTGSTAAMESLALRGLRTVLFVEAPSSEQLEQFESLGAFGVAGRTRAMTVDQMERELRPVFTKLRKARTPIVHYKICSTFDSSASVGSIGKVIDLGMDVFDSRFVPVLVGAPDLGRYCAFGNLFARSGPESEPFRLDRHPSMSRHPITPMDESDLRLALGKQTNKKVALFEVLNVEAEAEMANSELDKLLDSGPEVVVFDVLFDRHLASVGRLIYNHASRDKPLFVVGSSGLNAALGAYWTQSEIIPPAKPFPDPGKCDPIVVISGSCSPVTGKQIDYALECGFAEVPIDTVGLAKCGNCQAALGKASTSAKESLSRGQSVIVHTARGPGDPRIESSIAAFKERGLNDLEIRTRSGQVFGEALGKILRMILSEVEVGRAIVTGGDSAGHSAGQIGIESLEMIAPLTRGSPLCKVRAPGSPADGLEITFKGGQIGKVDFLVTVIDGRG